MMRPVMCVLAAIFMSASQTAPPVTPPAQTIYVTVTDADDRPVRDLDGSDFVISDEGREQRLSAFSRDAGSFSAVLMFDASPSVGKQNDMDAIYKGAKAFLEQMGPQDSARLGSFGGDVQLRPDTFSSDAGLLLNLLERVPATRGLGSVVWTAADAALEALEGRQGRRAVILVSDGNDVGPGRDGSAYDGLRGRAARSGTAIYAIGLRGTECDGHEPQPCRPVPANRRLKDLVAVTGGDYADHGDDYGQRMAGFADELHAKYALSFVPAAPDGRLHDLKVKVRRSGLRVRAPQHYLASSSRVSSPPR